MKLRIIFMSLLVSGIWYLASVSYADIPRTFNFQAKLTDNEGAPLEGSQQMTFALTDGSGATVWTQTKPVSITGGILNTTLGPFPEELAFDKEYSLSVSVAGQLLSPGQPLSSSPYALNAKRLEGLSSDSFIRKSPNGNVGIGTPAPAKRLEVKAGDGDGIRLNNTGDGFITWAYNNADRYAFRLEGARDYGIYDYVNNMYLLYWRSRSRQLGIGTRTPQAKLDVAGTVKADKFIGGITTGDIDFLDKTTGKTLWTMLEDKQGLYLISSATGKRYRLKMEEIDE